MLEAFNPVKVGLVNMTNYRGSAPGQGGAQILET